MRWESRKKIFLSRTLRNWKFWTCQKSTLGDSTKGGSRAKRRRRIRIPFRRWISQLGRKRSRIPKINLVQEDPAREEVRNDVLQGERDNKRVTQKPEIISGVLLGKFFVVITFDLDLNSSCQKKGHSLKAVDRSFPLLTIMNERPQNDYIVVQRKRY